jgi:nicotinamide-nucleotide amidase
VTLFQQFGRMPDERYKIQAYMPVGSTVLINKTGTASGMWFEHKNSIIVSMPGVPKEMKYLMEAEVLPRLQARKNIPAIEHQTSICYGKGETDLSDMLESFEAELPAYIKLAYLPNTTSGYVRLRLTGHGSDVNLLKTEVSAQTAKMRAILGNLVIGVDEQKIEEIVGQLLKEKNATFGTAESCTGGSLAHKITSVPGCSAYFKGSVVAYSNEIKTNVLLVNSETIAAHGAVSEETVREMAAGAAKVLDCDYVIATSGIAGPDGGTADKPVGTIWVAIAHPEGIISKKLTLGNNRERNIEMTSNTALNMLRMLLGEGNSSQ